MKSVEQNNALVLTEWTKVHNIKSGELNSLHSLQNCPTQTWNKWNGCK